MGQKTRGERVWNIDRLTANCARAWPRIRKSNKARPTARNAHGEWTAHTKSAPYRRACAEALVQERACAKIVKFMHPIRVS